MRRPLVAVHKRQSERRQHEETLYREAWLAQHQQPSLPFDGNDPSYSVVLAHPFDDGEWLTRDEHAALAKELTDDRSEWFEF